jgi:hypothetical protein
MFGMDLIDFEVEKYLKIYTNFQKFYGAAIQDDRRKFVCGLVFTNTHFFQNAFLP